MRGDEMKGSLMQSQLTHENGAVTFTIDSTSPSLLINIPTNDTNTSNTGQDINDSVTDTNLD